MRYERLGRTALRVSRLCLGTLNLGVRTSLEDAARLMDLALDHGINYFDTANHYGWQVRRGLTEEIIGDWFAGGDQRRDKVVLGTKVCNPMSDWANDSGLSARHIIASCEASLRRLRTDWIDVLHMHNVDPTAPWDEVWQAMETLVAQGKIRYVGSSNFAGWNIAAAQETAARRNFLGIVAEQCNYNLFTRDVEREVIPAARAYGVGVVAWSPLHGGLLGGALRKLADGTAVKSAQGRAMVALQEHRQVVADYEELCAGLGLDPAAVALAWVLSRPSLTAAVIGPRTAAHLESAVRAMETPLPAGTCDRLEAVFHPRREAAGIPVS
ncbi:aldo/keto reductase [Actinomadura sp. 7K534]|nr:aldo/keto reductase [Actinomadura sp. 7K534]TDB98897.1 aldo/keto reductase [Actinomadura sp. 7K534]GGU23175.1 putative oxidoreductase YrpG [Actinomadura livida]